MKHYRIFLALTVLVLASLACQAVMGGGNDTQETRDVATQPPSDSVEATVEPADSNDNENEGESEGRKAGGKGRRPGVTLHAS